jgi:hypothetical protein
MPRPKGAEQAAAARVHHGRETSQRCKTNHAQNLGNLGFLTGFPLKQVAEKVL